MVHKYECEGCGGDLRGAEKSLDQKTGFCMECRNRAFGRVGSTMHGGRPRHTEMKDRKTCNVVGASAAEFNSFQGY